MSSLLLVRHGQARAFDADSDRLSDLGAEQARKLGEHLVSSGAGFDEVHTGALVRQRKTAELVGNAFRAASKPWPVPAVDPSWNEYDAGGVMGTLLPALAARDAAFAARVQEFQAAAARPDKNKYFQRMFEVLMAAWQHGEVESEHVESFAAFHGRVSSAFGKLTSLGGSRRVAVFTSGGPIGVCVQTSVDAPKGSALKLNFRVKNASLTEMIFSEGRLSLESFNVVEYLPPEERSFR